MIFRERKGQSMFEKGNIRNSEGIFRWFREEFAGFVEPSQEFEAPKWAKDAEVAF